MQGRDIAVLLFLFLLSSTQRKPRENTSGERNANDGNSAGRSSRTWVCRGLRVAQKILLLCKVFRLFPPDTKIEDPEIVDIGKIPMFGKYSVTTVLSSGNISISRSGERIRPLSSHQLASISPKIDFCFLIGSSPGTYSTVSSNSTMRSMELFLSRYGCRETPDDHEFQRGEKTTNNQQQQQPPPTIVGHSIGALSTHQTERDRIRCCFSCFSWLNCW